MQSLDKIKQELKEKGYRSSSIRQEVLSFLIKKGGPISAQEIIAYLGTQGMHPNKTTIYRDIEKLLNEELIAEVDFLDGKKRYEIIKTKGEHHHHTICTNCGKIACVELDRDLSAIESYVEQKSGFKVEKHVLEFFGLCNDCSKNN